MTDNNLLQKILIIAGPTASGKSQVAIQLAKDLNGEIINLDSVQLYKDLNIGAAKLSCDEMQDVPHHLFSICDPMNSFDVARYISAANKVIGEVRERKKLPIFVGGTSLYITALLHGLVDLPASEKKLRDQLEERTSESLYEELSVKDSESAKSLHPNDRNRIIRALEAALLTSARISPVKEAHGYRDSVHSAVIIVPMWARSELYKRIDRRSEDMVKKGLIEEVRGLIAQYGVSAPALKSIGYNEAINHLKGNSTEEQLVSDISQNTRRFAKRQMTWLRNEPKKRGWEVSPSEDSNDGILLDGETNKYIHPKRLRHFRVLAPSFKELAEKVKIELNHGSPTIKVWFFDAGRLIE